MQGRGAGTGDDEDESRCEYATLTCRRPAAGETTVVHVKVWFHDGPDRHDARATVLRAHVLVADTGDVYSGRVTGREAVEANPAAASADDSAAAAVRRWLENARRALVGPRDGGEEYVHCLEGADGGAAALAWKRKLRPFGAVALGSVRLCRGGAVGGACRVFVGPLVGRVSAERLRADRAERAAAEDARRLSADNARLLDALRSVADRRRLDDDRLTARFVRVLNAKKERLAAVLRELKELKEERRLRSGTDDDESTAAVEPVVGRAGRRGGGRRGARGRAGKRGSTAARVTAGKRGRQQTTAGAWRPFSGFDGSDEMADDVEAVVDTRREAADDDGRQDTMETNDCGRGTDTVVAANPVSVPPDDADFDVFGADTQIDGDENGPQEKMESDDCGRGTDTVVAAYPVSAPPDDAGFDVFEADTQIDSDDPSSSPSFFHQIKSIQSAETDKPPSDKDVKPQNKSFLDDLWHGIL